MEDLIGAPTDPARFESFLADWEYILARRVDQAISTFAAIDGVRGLVLVGGIGRGEAWPLSDIDLIPIYDDDRFAQARDEVERARLAMLRPWIEEGWWTGLDIGRLAFRRSEIVALLNEGDRGLDAPLGDDRWYHSLDKAYRGQAVFDLDGIAAPLAAWFTSHRFHPRVARFRLTRTAKEAATAQRRIELLLAHDDVFGATTAVRDAVKCWQAWWLERWEARDASQARLGTRFVVLCQARGRPGIATSLEELSDLDEATVARRMAAAPVWVWERHDRSWRARQLVGEAVSQSEDARDVLRVCAPYESWRPQRTPVPAWLGIPVEAQVVRERAALLEELARHWLVQSEHESQDDE